MYLCQFYASPETHPMYFRFAWLHWPWGVCEREKKERKWRTYVYVPTFTSLSLLLLKGWEIKERTPFTGSTYETWFEPFSLKVYPYDSKRLRWTKKPLTSVQGMNPLPTWAKNFQLSASFKISFKTTKQLSICWKGKR